MYDPPILTDTCISGANLAGCIKEFNDIAGDGAEGIYLHDGVGNYTNATQEAGDGSYRFSGANPNNYVCFGSDAATCSSDNLYRIIGVFGNQVKLIKYDYSDQTLLGIAPVGTVESSKYPYYKGNLSELSYYHWSGSSDINNNEWSNSILNTTMLNGNYVNVLGNKWSDKIATTSWKVGGNTGKNIRDVPVKTAYQNEIVSPAESTTYSAKVGLMYVSDYGYAASPENWNTILYNYNNDVNRDSNWMYMGYSDWTITRYSGTSWAYFLTANGNIENLGVYNSSYAIRPTFYLNADITLISGDGSQNSPFQIS